ncbi:SLAM family member 8-like [Anas acuta]|uniref:SLAM family member 8-like n=1 Tax=Anas acuta TaxID=28680 RepID=UPI0035C8B307
MGEPCGRRRPLHPQLLTLLLIAAGSVGAQLQPVSGVRGRSVLLSPALPYSSEVKTAEWYFRGSTRKKIRVAEFGPEGFERPDPHDRFKQRLEMPNATALRIGGLELGDSGIYRVLIKYNSTTEVEDQDFNLSVYDPVPTPQIQTQLLSRSPQGCNVTLNCSLPPPAIAQTSWHLDKTSGTLWGHSGDGQTLWLTIPPDALDATYTCVARSPAEEQSSSISLSALCQIEGGRQRWAICLGVLAAIAGPLSVLCYLRRRRRRRKADEGAPGVAEEPQYAQVPRRGPAKEDEAPPQPSAPLRTIYSEVGAGTHSLAQPQA